jgi:hypothetical protein
MVMPGGMDGRTLCLEARLRAPHVKSLLISGYSTEEMVAPKVGGDLPLLKKPFTSLELQSTLDGLFA